MAIRLILFVFFVNFMANLCFLGYAKWSTSSDAKSSVR